MRIDLNTIVEYVAEGSHVLDLGCGDGTLLSMLQQQKRASGTGLEKDFDKITECVSKGLSVVEYDLNRGLSRFADKSFDLVIMTQTLQVMDRPDIMLDEMLRVGKECIVTFPNFGHWKARWYLSVLGRMPVSDLLPFEWYDTPNIHFCTVKDFESLCCEHNIVVLHREVLAENKRSQWLCHYHPNLFGETAVYHLSR